MSEFHIGSVALVGLGGAAGSVARYLISFALAPSWLSQNWIPAGTLLVNVLGCLLLAFLASSSKAVAGLGDSGRQLVLIGMLGGFTTFSTFGYQTLELVRNEHMTRAALNVALNVVLGLLACWVGVLLARGGRS